MDLSKAGSSKGPVTRRRAAQELRENEEKKRSRKMWKPRKVIGPNDIIVDTNKGKIKIEEDVDVKDVLERASAPDQAQDPTQEEISSGHLNLEERETTPEPVVKVEYIKGDASIQEEIRNVLLEEVDIPMDCGNDYPGGVDNAGMNEVNNDEVRSQCGSCCREEIELLKSTLRDQNQKIKILMSRVTENEKELAEVRRRLQKQEENAALSLPSDVDECNAPEPSNLTSGAFKDRTEASSVIPENNDATEITDNHEVSNEVNEDAAIRLETSDDKVVTLFPEVIKVFWTKYAKGMEDSKSYLNLNCRLICKTWRDGIDYLLMNENGLIKVKGREVLEFRCYDGSKFCEDKAKKTVAKMFDMYKNNKKGWRLLQPRELHIFTGKSVLSKLCSNSSKYGKAISKFLVKFGSGIEKFQHCNQAWYSSSCDYFVEAYSSSTFKNWILQMPNLKYLSIFHDNKLNPDPEVIKSTNIEELIQLHFFPNLEKLTTFKIYAPEALSSVIIPMAITNNNHISSFSSNMSVNFSQFCLPNLADVTCVPNWDTNLSALPALNSFDGKISISLSDIHFRESNARRDLWNVMSTMETITEIHLDSCFVTLDARPLKFPNLKTLVLNIQYDPSEKPSFTVQLIFKMVSQLSSLERLEIFGLREDTCRELENRAGGKTGKLDSEQLRFGGTRAQCTKCLRKELVCRLGKIIPSLKLIKVERIILDERWWSTQKDYFSFHRI